MGSLEVELWVCSKTIDFDFALQITISYLPFPWTDFQIVWFNLVVLSILRGVIEMTFCSKFIGLGVKSFLKSYEAGPHEGGF